MKQATVFVVIAIALLFATGPLSGQEETTATVPERSTDFLMASLISGDAEFDGHDPRITGNIRLQAEGSVLYLIVRIRMQEAGRPGGKNTVAEINKKTQWFRTSDGSLINRVEYTTHSEVDETDIDSQPIHRTCSDCVYSKLHIVADGIGADVGHHSGIEVTVPEFQVVIVP